ncbi:hypothetical protein SCATT_p04890 (plasmid) [Streptantibioticus cattleyicolor NRRL 8057 = DSM 46488]|uniref:Uncharacterized protein n=1 Tax=Streptantibioticus cattleyicolor (strain ATCC 35852 / DSM 46488 / JCM 4925 / NBRC 14057 / NRRL 8057) TaxID=1003195 RepID=G8XGC4_STREN|nr:hypothetical protein SCATT_p04890 [Streptantibioticus cattleyicolor NRRL 8057 = DSM 46488]
MVKAVSRRSAMEWWGWVVFLVAVAGVLTATALTVQARRRSGTVIAIRSGRVSGREGPR